MKRAEPFLELGVDDQVVGLVLDEIVIADSQSDPEKMDNHLNRPEIREALETGTGSARRMSDTVKREFLYVARKTEAPGGDHIYIRAAAPSTYTDATIGH